MTCKFLTPQRQAAADYFVIHGNKTASFRHAYACENRSDVNVRASAATLFKRKDITEYVLSQQRGIQELAAAKSEHAVVNSAWVLRRAAMLANFNIRRFIRTDDNGHAVYDFSEATDDDWYCIDEYTYSLVDVGKEGGLRVDKIKIKTSTKIRALELVGRHVSVQAFKDTTDSTVTLETYELTDTERDARINAILDRGRARRDRQTID